MSKQVTVRFDDETVNALDARAEQLAERLPGSRPTRSDALREIVALALSAESADKGAGK